VAAELSDSFDGTSAGQNSQPVLEIDGFACFLLKLASPRVYARNEKTNFGSGLHGRGFFDVGWNTAGVVSPCAGGDCFSQKFNIWGANRLPANN
jgi:hypothetical protein